MMYSSRGETEWDEQSICLMTRAKLLCKLWISDLYLPLLAIPTEIIELGIGFSACCCDKILVKHTILLPTFCDSKNMIHSTYLRLIETYKNQTCK